MNQLIPDSYIGLVTLLICGIAILLILIFIILPDKPYKESLEDKQQRINRNLESVGRRL